MMDGYIIKKSTDLQEGISGSMLFECQFSDYELYQILESNGYKTTNENKDILKKGIQEGRYYIWDEDPNRYDTGLTEALDLYSLIEDEIIPEILDEEVLNEKIRFGNQFSIAGRGNNLANRYNATDISVESLVRDYIKYKLGSNKNKVSAEYLRTAARNDDAAEKIRSQIKEEVAKGKNQNKYKIDSLRTSYFAILDKLYTKESKEERDSNNAVNPVRLKLKEDASEVLNEKLNKLDKATIITGSTAGAVSTAGLSVGFMGPAAIAAGFGWAGAAALPIAAIALIYGMSKAVIVLRKKLKEKQLEPDVSRIEKFTEKLERAKKLVSLQVEEFKKKPENMQLLSDLKKSKTRTECKQIIKKICKALKEVKSATKINITDDSL